MSHRTTPRLFFSGLRESLGRKVESTSTLEMELVAEDTSLENTHNTAGHPNLKTYNGKQYIAYYDDGRYITLGMRTITATTRGEWTFNKLDSGKTFPKQLAAFDDNHDTISIGFDETGIMHVAWGMHNDALTYFMMPSANTVVGEPTDNLAMTGSNENLVAYPFFFNRPSDGKLYFSFRQNTADRYIFEYAQGTDTWTGATGASTNGLWLQSPGTTQYDRVYISNPYMLGDVAHFACNWYDNAAPHGNDLFFVAYDMLNGEFLQADKTAQTVPVTELNHDLILAISPPDGSGLGTMGDRNIYVDNSGKISIAAQYTDSNDVQQIYMHTHDGSATGSWSAGTQLTFRVADRRDKGYNPLFVHPSTGIWYLLFQSHKDSLSLQCIESRDNGTTWSSPYPVFAPRIRRAEGSYDFEYWDANGELYTPYEISFDVDNGDSAFVHITHKLRHLYLEHWIPSEGKTRVDFQPPQLLSEEDVNIRSFSGRVNIGGETVVGSNEDTQVEFSQDSDSMVVNHYAHSTLSPKYQFYRANGTKRSPTAVSDTDSVSQVTYFAYIDGAFRTLGGFSTAIDGTPSASSYPMRYNFSSVVQGATTTSVRLRFNGDGSIDSNLNPQQNFALQSFANAAALPASATAGRMAFVTDIAKLAYDDGTNWRRVDTDATL